jgi:hypothetical protein
MFSPVIANPLSVDLAPMVQVCAWTVCKAAWFYFSSYR